MQSQWIMDYGKNKEPEQKVAKEWIAANKDVVAKMVERRESCGRQLCRGYVQQGIFNRAPTYEVLRNTPRVGSLHGLGRHLAV